MKAFILILLTVLSVPARAQEDSSAYQVQRRKINLMLAERSARFGQYDESLVKRTGIFGMKTKKDMQRSINILTEIIRTDNDILRETKILLDYKDLEKTKVQGQFSETQTRVNNFMSTINKLQKQNEKLKADLEKNDQDHTKTISIIIGLALLVFSFGLLYFKRKN